MITKVNALGDACPLPVIKAKKALRENSEIVISVDNEIATQNLEKMAKQLGYLVEITQESEKAYHVTIFRNEGFGLGKNLTTQVNSQEHVESDMVVDEHSKKKPTTSVGEDSQVNPYVQEKSYIVVVSSKAMGVGNNELGKTLLKAFIYSLTEQDVLPSHLLFYNEGAKLTTDSSPILEDLKRLDEANVEILTCGACLDYFELKEKLAVGEVTNMYHIVELMSSSHVVRP